MKVQVKIADESLQELRQIALIFAGGMILAALINRGKK